MRTNQKSFYSPRFWIRLLHWEYWPFQVIYFPVYPVWFWYCLKARSFFFFAAANPSIDNGGFLMESKKQIDRLLPKNLKPVTLFFRPGTAINLVMEAIRMHGVEFPLIVKPDTGLQGIGVCKVDSPENLARVIDSYNINYIIQPFVTYPNEIGLFYVRYPNQPRGFISGIVKKEFLQLTGDGRHNMEELIRKNDRYILQLPVLKEMLGDRIHAVLPAGVTEVLVPFGNHARGSLFTDASDWKNEALEELFDEVCGSVRHFYYGRLDIRYHTLEDLKQNKNWSIIELNGAGSEPTHMYDPRHSVFFAWKEIIRHWKLLYEISRENRARGARYLSLSDGLAMFRNFKLHRQKLQFLTRTLSQNQG